MTKKHFIDAAAIVRNILQGEWATDFPHWADPRRNVSMESEHPDGRYTRAVQTAEAFVMLFTQHNDRFDTQRFLIACGLVAAPVKTRKRSR